MPKNPPPEGPKNNPPDPAAAKKAYEAMIPRMNALAKDQLSLLNVDAQESAIIALSISRFLAEPEPSAFPSLYASSGAGRPKKAKEPAPPPAGEGGTSGGGK